RRHRGAAARDRYARRRRIRARRRDPARHRQAGPGRLRLAELRRVLERARELRLVDGIGNGVEELEGSELAAKHRAAGGLDRENAHDVLPALGDLAQELEPRAILEPLGRYQHVVFVRPQQVDARDLAGGDVHFEGATDGLEGLGIRIGDQYTHGGAGGYPVVPRT